MPRPDTNPHTGEPIDSIDSGNSSDSAPSSPPANPPTNFSNLEAFLLEAIRDPTNADKLAQSLANPRIRDSLRDRGVKVVLPTEDPNANSNRPRFNTLPRELRDIIRMHVVKASREDWRTRSLASLACVDSEWREAIEAITFQSLTKLRSADLPLFEKYIAGKRRQQLQRLDVDPYLIWAGDLSPGFTFSAHTRAKIVSCICRLLTLLSKWDVNHTNPTSSGLNITFKFDQIRDGAPKTPLEYEDIFRELPVVTAITRFTIPFYWRSMGTKSLFMLFSKMPNLRSADVVFVCRDWMDPTRSQPTEESRQATYYERIKRRSPLTSPQSRMNASQLDTRMNLLTRVMLYVVFFNGLAVAVPKLDTISIDVQNPIETRPELHGFDYAHGQMFHAAFVNAILGFAQRLRTVKLSTRYSYDLQALFTRPSHEQRGSESQTMLTWPQLMHLDLGQWRFRASVGKSEAINHMLVVLGRDLKQMPRLQQLTLKVRTVMQAIRFTLEWFSSENVARLTVTYSDDVIGRPISGMPSDEVVQVWEDSIKHATGAAFQVQVVELTGR